MKKKQILKSTCIGVCLLLSFSVSCSQDQYLPPPNKVKSFLKCESAQDSYNKDITWKEYPGDGPSICFMGDSRIDWFPVNYYWPNRHIWNIGKAGSTTQGALMRVSQVKEFNPDIILVSVGGNDTNICGLLPQMFELQFSMLIDHLKPLNAKIYITNVVPVSNILPPTINEFPPLLLYLSRKPIMNYIQNNWQRNAVI